MYNKGKFCIDSDFEIRTVREEGNDIDLFIPIGNRTLNLYFDDNIKPLYSRMQFSIVRNLIIRYSLDAENNIATIHMLRSIDLHSSVVNFEIDYRNHVIEIKDREYFVEMRIINKEAVDKLI
ncbi:hypothetical protein [Maledivibacter halophilus]|uniref:Uncharacterized protein n=1 Tax=Maledivibacter halophilus TaxID=36842 RepID=A0A1T5MBR7_9FIRM|nr:hypothetical protein [Maledivibacter halophilus]SKC85434.1 hypothetical protein SAMN02194393_04353 [Maledivibacter halophilus]